MHSTRDSLIKKGLLAALAVSLVLMGALAPADAQGRWVRLDGRVQWIAGEKMMLIPDYGGLPVNVDLTRVRQDEYSYLTQGTQVIVIGVVSSDGRRLIATSITPSRGWGEQSP